MQIRFSPESVEDLKRLYEFIAEHDMDAARTTALNLKSAINRFADFPHIGHPLEDLVGVREFVFGRYVIRCMIRSESLYVLRVWHGREER